MIYFKALTKFNPLWHQNSELSHAARTLSNVSRPFERTYTAASGVSGRINIQFLYPVLCVVEHNVGL
jgi:hypothetical protein